MVLWVQSMVVWVHVVGQNIMVTGTYDGKELWMEKQRENSKKGSGIRYSKDPTSSDPVLQIGFLLKLPEPPT